MSTQAFTSNFSEIVVPTSILRAIKKQAVMGRLWSIIKRALFRHQIINFYKKSFFIFKNYLPRAAVFIRFKSSYLLGRTMLWISFAKMRFRACIPGKVLRFFAFVGCPFPKIGKVLLKMHLLLKRRGTKKFTTVGDSKLKQQLLKQIIMKNEI